jgi:hypothetical protein
VERPRLVWNGRWETSFEKKRGAEALAVQLAAELRVGSGTVVFEKRRPSPNAIVVVRRESHVNV